MFIVEKGTVVKVLSHRLDTAISKPGMVITVKKTLRTSTGGSTPLARQTLRLLLDKFWKEWSAANKVEPELIGPHELFLPHLEVDSLPRVKAALRSPYRFHNRTISQKPGAMTLHSPHAFLWRDVVFITTMAGVKDVHYADKAFRRRNALDITLGGQLTIDAVMRGIDSYMK